MKGSLEKRKEKRRKNTPSYMSWCSTLWTTTTLYQVNDYQSPPVPTTRGSGLQTTILYTKLASEVMPATCSCPPLENILELTEKFVIVSAKYDNIHKNTPGRVKERNTKQSPHVRIDNRQPTSSTLIVKTVCTRELINLFSETFERSLRFPTLTQKVNDHPTQPQSYP